MYLNKFGVFLHCEVINLGDYAFFGPSVKFTWLCLKT